MQDTFEHWFHGAAYRRLRSIAAGLLRRSKHGCTMQPTVLVHELFLKLRRFESGLMGDDHFYHLSARAMRQVLIDRSRSGAHKYRASESEAQVASVDSVISENVVAVRNTLERLRAIDRAAAEVLWLRIVEGMTLEEVSRRQQREVWRVRMDHDFGLQWMKARLGARR